MILTENRNAATYDLNCQGLKLLKKARNEGKLEIVTRREVGQPANMRNVFRKIERVAEDEDDDNQDDVDEVTDLEQKIK